MGNYFMTPPAKVVPDEEPIKEIPITTNEGVAEAVAKEFGRDSIMYIIAACESTGSRNGTPRHYDSDGQVLLGRINPDDKGVFQINSYYHLEASKKMGIDIFTVEGNIKYARHLYDTQGVQPWSWSRQCWG